MKNSRLLLVFTILISIAFTGCKKDNSKPYDDNELLLRDSTYYYTLVFSLWQNQLPQPKMKNETEIDLRAFTGNFNTAEEVLDEIKEEYTKLDRFSFIDRAGVIEEEIGQGVHKDFGIVPDYFSPDGSAKNAKLYIKLVQKNSPAEKAGITRGMEVISIDGNKDIDYLSQSPSNFKLVNQLFGGPDKISVEVKNPVDGKILKADLVGGQYKIDPILLSKVVDFGGKKVGYIAYTSFVEVTNKKGNNEYYTAMVNAISELANKGIEELVVDLRYNGGGAGTAAELMTNLIAPTSVGTGVMYRYKVNSILQGWGWDDETKPDSPFKPVHFKKTNSLNLSRVYFLGTKGTASASELVINSLKPHMQVEVITTNDEGTYGKPVGFFGYPVVNNYADLYIVSFQTLNSNGDGDYFNGFIGGVNVNGTKDSYDDITHQFGDVQEKMFADALNHIKTGSYNVTSASSRRSSSRVAPIQSINSLQANSSVLGMFKFSKEKAVPRVK